MGTPPTFADIRSRFFAAIAVAVGLEPAVFDRPGTTVVSSAGRAGTGIVAIHAIGDHSLVWADPAVVAHVETLRSDTDSFPIDTLATWAPAHGAEFVGGARSLLADAGMLAIVDPPAGSTPIGLDRDDPTSLTLVSALLDASDPDDVDAAEMDLDALDPHIIGLLDGSGSLGAIASERPWEYDGQFGNIGVLVHPDRRHRGWGRAAVSILAREVLDRGRFPLYRCNWDREPSHRLALSLGFRETTSLAAVRFEL